MSCSSGFTAYFPSLTQKGKRKISLDFLYHGNGPVDWCETIDFFGLPQTNGPGMLAEWEAFVPLSQLVEYFGPLTFEELIDRHHNQSQHTFEGVT